MRDKLMMLMLLALSLIGNTKLAAQNSSCGFADPTQANSSFLHQQLSGLNQQEVDDAITATQYIPIQAHIFRMDDQSGGLTATELQEAIDVVNQQYSSMNMVFFQCSDINYVDDSNLYDLMFTAEDKKPEEDAWFGFHDVDNVINIYFFNSVTKYNGDGLCGYAYYPSSVPRNRVIMDNGCTMNGSTLAHELGHFFGLFHTHGRDNNCGATDELADGSNCATAGDEICDTPADPRLSNSCGYYDGATCTYLGGITDANGDEYAPLTDNIMSYASSYLPDPCRQNFTYKQLERALCTAISARSYLDPNACDNAPPTTTEPPVAECPDNLNLTENIAGAEAHEAGIELTASNTVYSGAVVSYDAGTTVLMTDGFLAENGSDFIAYLDGCNEENVTYCIPETFGTVYIHDVKLFNSNATIGDYLIDNNSNPYDDATNGYSDYTTAVPPANLNFDDVYEFIIDNDFAGGNYLPTDWRVWIDFNQDGDFEDAGELVIDQQSFYDPTENLYGSFMVPPTALLGETRMRVGVFFEGNAEPPCSTFNYGEFEDYAINIDPNAFRLVADALEEPEIVSNITAFPNPTNDLTNIIYTLEGETQVSVLIYASTGKLLDIVTDNEIQQAGTHKVQFDARHLPNGSYYYHLRTGYRTYSNKLMIVK